MKRIFIAIATALVLTVATVAGAQADKPLAPNENACEHSHASEHASTSAHAHAATPSAVNCLVP